MTSSQTITRLGSGPGERRIDEPFWAVVGGKPRATLEAGYNDASGRLKAGTAAYAPGAIRLDGYPHDEYCFILEGELVVTAADGEKETYKPGDAFLMPRGFRGTWDMPGGLKKYYVIFDPNVTLG